ncbi:acyl-CoA reductase-like NAD-dependent aldehyde dehydrogenase [Paraburkholderia sp. GAS448]|uniref:hypothetical protein n=1 Tax=Paraburkholderia sp. GAS448 TaxID=3035136 RepID=UPI003D192B55
MRGSNGTIRATNAATGAAIERTFGGARAADLDAAFALAGAAFDTYRETSLEARALNIPDLDDEHVTALDIFRIRAKPRR